MCNIAGYVGTRPAAPILCDMMERESGFFGGYYTGIATVSDGRLYWDKVLGDTDRLYASSDVRALPGHTGIMHSRSNSGGDRSWAHPFVSNDECFAYVANGSLGEYKDDVRFPRNAVAQAMESAGYTYVSKSHPIGSYPTLSDGSGVHISEVMCHLIRDKIKHGTDPERAMHEAYCEYPSEIVSLGICADEPDAIFAARINQPMMLGRAKDGIYLATTEYAFPRDVDFISVDLLPANCSATIRRDGWEIHGFIPQLPVARIDAAMQSRAYTMIREHILTCGRPVSFKDCRVLTQELWPAGYVPQPAVLCYNVICALLKTDEVRLIACDEPGAPEGAAENVRTRQFYLVKA